MSFEVPPLLPHVPELDRSVWSMILDNAPVGICVERSDGTLVWYNKTLTEQLGLPMSATRFTRVTDLPIRDLNVVSRYTTSSDGERLQVRFFTAEAAEPEMRPRLMEMLRAQAGIDAQTGLLDRATIGRLLRSEISRSRRYGNPLSVARYTAGTATVNDSDLVQATMATVAETLKEHLRWTDSVGRSSAQSLLLVLPETDAGAVAILLGKIRAAIGDREGGLTWTTWRRGDNLDSLLSRVAAVESATVVPISKLHPGGYRTRR